MNTLIVFRKLKKIDGYTVLQHMEKGEFDKILFKRWEKKKCMRYIFRQITVYSILQ